MRKFTILFLLSLFLPFGCGLEDELNEPEIDLILTHLELYYQDFDNNNLPSLGDNFLVKSKITNGGYNQSDQAKIKARLYREGTNGTILEATYITTLPPLNGGDQDTFDLFLDILANGNYLVKYEIDSDDEIPEFDESNNERELEFSVGHSANTEVDLISLISVVDYDDIDLNGQLSVGDRINLTILVKNIGEENVGETNLGVATYVENQLKQTITIPVPNLNGNQSISIDVEISTQYGSGNYMMVSLADYDNITMEGNETNNQHMHSEFVHP